MGRRVVKGAFDTASLCSQHLLACFMTDRGYSSVDADTSHIC